MSIVTQASTNKKGNHSTISAYKYNPAILNETYGSIERLQSFRADERFGSMTNLRIKKPYENNSIYKGSPQPTFPMNETLRSNRTSAKLNEELSPVLLDTIPELDASDLRIQN